MLVSSKAKRGAYGIGILLSAIFFGYAFYRFGFESGYKSGIDLLFHNWENQMKHAIKEQGDDKLESVYYRPSGEDLQGSSQNRFKMVRQRRAKGVPNPWITGSAYSP